MVEQGIHKAVGSIAVLIPSNILPGRIGRTVEFAVK